MSETSTSSDHKFFFRSAFVTETHLKRLPASFILSPLPTALSYLGKLLMGSEASGRAVREVAREGRHAETGLKRSRSLGKKPSHLDFWTVVCSVSAY